LFSNKCLINSNESERKRRRRRTTKEKIIRLV
jgi:hypothetical protein